MDEHQREEHLRTACRAADQEWRAAGEAARRGSDRPYRVVFERGDRVALEYTGDPHTRLRPGDEGTVTGYDPSLGQLDVRWDSGSTLAMLLDDGDRVRLITSAPWTGETGKDPGR